MKKILICCLLFLLGGKSSVLQAAMPPASVWLKTMQMNVWKGGSKVEGSIEMIADVILRSKADLVCFNEMRKYEGEHFITRLIRELRERGETFYGSETSFSAGVLSRYPIEDERVIRKTVRGHNGPMLRVLITVGGRKVAVYSTHLDYTHYACYAPRGYNGSTWKKMDAPLTDEALVLEMNRKAHREEQIAAFLKEAKPDFEQGNIVLLTGDFNEPSHLDWQEDTKDLWEHNGAVVNWDCSRMLYAAGFKDAYRVIYPNPVTHPGFTFPAGNTAVPVKELTWAPDADERDRIDFIYYHAPAPGVITPRKAWVVGPSLSVVRSELKEEQGRDRFWLPKGGWPTDHKAVMVTFKIKSQKLRKQK